MKLTTGDQLEGVAGTATEILVEGPFPRPELAATLASWFLHCPGQSPAWSHYVLSVIHLRPIEGARPAVIRVPGATHEVVLLALDPTLEPQPTDSETWSFLTPVNVMEQVELPGDDQAVTLCRLSAQAVVAGYFWAEPPLSGQVEPWRTSMIKTAAHLRGEEHAP